GKLSGDAYALRTIRDGTNRWLVICGGSSRAVLYGVYHLLDRYCEIGFFWDGEYVPKRTTIALPEINITERPHFPVRQHLQGCAFGYTTRYWEFDDWRREIDWMAKKRLNRMMLPWGDVSYRVWRKFGIMTGEPSPRHHYKIALARRIATYARALGIECILPGYIGNVPREFIKRYPNCRYVDVKWGELPPSAHLYPTDPMFRKIGAEMIREYIAEYGTDHIYNIDPYPETRPGATPQERRAIKIDFARNVIAFIKDADPKGIWYASGWAFIDAQYWTPEDVRKFMEQIPQDSFYVCDIWAERHPIYKRFDYFYGKQWGFSVLHSFGGDDHMRGDIRDLIRRAQDVATDARARKCIAFYINPEIIHYNTLYFELAAHLSWNPLRVSADDFLQWYAVRRYGRESAPTMLRALKLLANSVYGRYEPSSPRYQRRQGHNVIMHPVSVMHRGMLVKSLRHAIAIALTELERQAKNELFHRDIVDMLRQYITELYNHCFWQAHTAYRYGDVDAFERAVARMNKLMDALEELLASFEPYCIHPIVSKAMRMPGVTRAIEREIKDGMFTFVNLPWLRDYQSKDMFELVRFYYRPRMDAYFAALRNELRGALLPSGAQNLLKNGGFEGGNGDVPAVWHTDFVHQSGRALRDNAVSFTGDWSGKVEVTNGGYANLHQVIDARGGEVFLVTARIKVHNATNAHLHYDAKDANGKLIAQGRIGRIMRGSSDWRTCAGCIIAPKGTRRLVIYCRIEGNGVAWFDDVAVYRTDLASAPILLGATLDRAYDEIERRFIEKPLPTVDSPPQRKPMAQVLPRVFELVRRIDDGLQESYMLAIVGKPGRIGWREEFDDIKQWRMTYAGGEMSCANGIATMRSKTKWFLFGTKVDVDIKRYPILAFRYRVIEGDGRGAWIWVTWEDESGSEVRSLVWNEGMSRNWESVAIDLERILLLIGRPMRIKFIELNNQAPPHVVQWDYLRLCERAR
ncbi:MAG TPA: hypothetical protein EYP10_15225, partial [Armatimonadetes bacterium]|nr:hypothetical protein [Armatimonadota bacterium]